MSQYPYDHSQWPEWPEQRPQPHHNFNPAGQPPPPAGHSGPPVGMSIEANYVVSQTSFDYNANRIPGLGITGWDYADQNAWPSSSSRNARPQDSTLYPTRRESHYPLPQAQALPSSHPPSGGAVEEGELSEEASEDLYEPARARDAAPPPDLDVRAPVVIPDSRDDSEPDLPDNAFYEEDEPEETTSDAHGASTSYPADEESLSDEHLRPAAATGRERSGSYSPYLSPREIHHEDTTPEEPQPDGSTSQVPEYTANGPPPNSGEPGERLNGVASADDERDPAAGRLLTTVDEAKKEAQKSILRLFPYGVKYQTYIDEGFNENVIKSLFTELGLNPTSSAKSDLGPGKQLGEAEKTITQTDGASSQATNSNKTDKPEKAEERKDRIARLLAEKASRPTPPVTPQPAEVPEKPTTEKAKSAKELLLQKMEALQKARDAKAAQLAVQTTSPIQAETLDDPTALTVPVRSQGTEVAPDISQASAISSPEGESQSQSQSQNQDQDQSQDRDQDQSQNPDQDRSQDQDQDRSQVLLPPPPHKDLPSIRPSLVSEPPLSTSQPSTVTTQGRKRPVASDFDDYPSTGTHSKRPFVQSRYESTLIIDISDGSGDEDVEMDMDSPPPADGPSLAIQQACSPNRKGLSFRDHRPLSDFSRIYASSVSSVTTPPNGPSNGASRLKDDEYSRKMREIEEMKRKIAEAEAKKARKTSSTPAQTPSGRDSTPPEGDAPRPAIQRAVSPSDIRRDDGSSPQHPAEAVPAKLPKPSALSLSQESGRERRARIASVHLPKVEITLKEKTSKLRLMQDKISQLQVEIEEIVVQKSRLTEEMEALDVEPSSNLGPPGTQPAVARSSRSGELEVVQPVSVLDTTASPLPEEQTTSQDMEEEDDGDQPMALDEEDSAASSTGDENVELSSGDGGSNDRSDKVPDRNNPSTADQYANGTDTPLTDAEAGSKEIVAADGITSASEREQYEPAQAATSAEPEAEADHLSLDSAPFSPTLAEGSSGVGDSPGTGADTVLPAQISDVATADAASEEQVGNREVPVVSSTLGGQALTSPQAANAASEPDFSFTPYESPLRYFRSYRFHPQFEDNVAGGQRSLTFSHTIDTNVAVCPYELDGQECPNGTECQFQHFRSMAARGACTPPLTTANSRRPSSPPRSLTSLFSPLR